jgi:hypothetical protein
MSDTVENVVDWRSWVAALRSDKYKQGKGYLRSYRGYCCWGVACDIVNSNGWRPSKDAGTHIFEYGYDGHQGIPPRNVIEALGVERLGVCAFMSMNDNGVSFKEIANKIEMEMLNDTTTKSN